MRVLLGPIVACGLLGCSSPKPKPEPVVYRWPERTTPPPEPAAAAATDEPTPPGATTTATPADPVEEYLVANPGLSERLVAALRARTLVAGGGGMSTEQVLLVVPRSAVLATNRKLVEWTELDGTPRSAELECWELDRYQRWRVLYFDRGRLRGWLTWTGNDLELPD